MNDYKINYYTIKNGKLCKLKLNKWKLFIRKLKIYLTKFKLVNTWKYEIVPFKDKKYYFKLSPKEYEDAEKIYKEKGTISYEFIPSAIGWGVKVHVLKTDEIIDITDVSSW